MINKTLLKKILLFEKTQPVFSIIKTLNEVIIKYQNDNEVYFFSASRGQRANILNEELFFEFVSQELLSGKKVTSFNDIKKILYADTRVDNIKYSGDSKTNYIRVFDNVVVVKKLGQIAQLVQEKDLDALALSHGYVVVENGESFLNVDTLNAAFKYDTFVYLGGYANTLTRKFLEDKKVEFFCDFDIEGMNIYESISCLEKSFYLPKNIDLLFEKFPNTELYKKQIKNLKENYDKKLDVLLQLITKNNTVVEQEVCT